MVMWPSSFYEHPIVLPRSFSITTLRDLYVLLGHLTASFRLPTLYQLPDTYLVFSGKFHGACPTGPGPDPTDSPEDPWPGTCGDPDSPSFGRGNNTFTAGFEGQWTAKPTVWDNTYFQYLLEFDWELEQSPGGNPQCVRF